MMGFGDGVVEVADRFRTAVLTGEADAIGEVLSDDVLFYSPASVGGHLRAGCRDDAAD